MVSLTPLQVGPVSTPSNLVLSPMSGVTDSAFRRLVRRCSGDAVGLLVSEFIAAEGLSRHNAKTMAMLRYRECERPISIQIFGADVDRMVRASLMVEEAGADIVDINCGCPAPKVVKRGGGAGLMRDPSRLRQVIAGVRAAVSIPVTMKFRSGWDDDNRNVFECARIAEGEGASMIAVHGRTRVQMYRGSADWSLVRELRGLVSIPVLGSGDVIAPAQVEGRLGEGYADGVMIGRAAIDNPWIFAQAAAHLDGKPLPQPTRAERLEAMHFFRDALREDLPERAFMGRYRGMACRMVKGMAGSAVLRQAVGASADIAEIDAHTEEFLLGVESAAA